MEMRLLVNSNEPSCLIFVCLLFTTAFLYGCGNVDNGAEMAPPNELVQTLTVEVVCDGKATPLGESVDLVVNTGVILQMHLIPNEKRPDEYLDREMASLEDWGMQMWVYREGTSNMPPSAELSFTVPLADKPSDLASRIGGYSMHWSYCGFLDIKPLKKPVGENARGIWKKGEGLWFWTYLCGGKDHTGEFVYEIRLLPTAQAISAVRYEVGNSMILQRGKLHITE